MAKCFAEASTVSHKCERDFGVPGRILAALGAGAYLFLENTFSTLFIYMLHCLKCGGQERVL